MKRVPVVILWMFLIGGCAQQNVAPTVEENSNLVKVEGEPPVVFPVREEVPLPLLQLERAQARPYSERHIFLPTLGTEPPLTTQLSDLREVKVSVDLQGFDPAQLTVEFTAPEGNVFDRQTKQLSMQRTARQFVEFALPVAGTLITSANLVGTWRAVIFRNDVELTTLTFEVTP